MTHSGFTLYQFQENADLSNWYIVNDGVMGGLSNSELVISQEGHGLFKGHVSLENNGGFASLRYEPQYMDISGLSKFVLRIKGDKQPYQFRAKASWKDYHSYIYLFETTGEWETIEIPFDKMAASFRGRLLNMDNYQGDLLSELGFLIGNKKETDFELLIDKISIQ